MPPTEPAPRRGTLMRLFGPSLVLAAVGALPLSAAEVPEAVEQAKCGRCHTVKSAGLEAQVPERMAGPALDELDEELDPKWVAAYIRRTEDLNGKKHPLPFKGSDEELQAIVDWVISLADDGGERR